MLLIFVLPSSVHHYEIKTDKVSIHCNMFFVLVFLHLIINLLVLKGQNRLRRIPKELLLFLDGHETALLPVVEHAFFLEGQELLNLSL